MDWQLTLRKGCAYNGSKLFSRLWAALTLMRCHLLSPALSVFGAVGLAVTHEPHLAIRTALPIEPFPRKTNRLRHTFCILLCHCMGPTAVAALLNQSCLPVLLQGTRDPLFLTGVTFPSEYPIYEETKIKLTVYDVKDKSHDTVSTCTYFFFGGERSYAFPNYWVWL